jgi:patatin-like phospholipase/acyl hydrolase
MARDESGAHPIRVLSIDGGGIRGIIPARILKDLERRTGAPVSSLFDIMAGTSTGGILVLGLTKPEGVTSRPAHSAAEMMEFYAEFGPVIFSKTLGHWLTSLDGLVRSRYPDSRIEKVLVNFFGDARLKDATTPVFIPSYELERHTPFFFRSAMARTRADYDFPMHVVARSTSAAPTYFPPEKIPISGTSGYYALIDGGVFANNPAACVYAETRASHPEASDITLVSLGTGKSNPPVSLAKAEDWGVAQWARPILDTVLDGVSSTVEYQVRSLLPARLDGTERYFRLQTTLSERNSSLDNVAFENLEALRTEADRLVKERSGEIDRICEALLL